MICIGGSRLRWARSVVRAEGGRGRLSKPKALRLMGPAAAAPGPAHRVSRAKMKNLKKVKSKNKEKQAPGPPPRSILGEAFVLAK